MSSVIDICNAALSNVRAASINSLTEPSIPAQQCKLKYPMVRDIVQRDAPWNFCHKIDELAELMFVDVFNWSYSYQHPSDCLLINRLITATELAYSQSDVENNVSHSHVDLTRQVKYEVVNVEGNRVIVVNEPTMRIDYRARVTDSSIFDPEFSMAVSWLLAAELAMTLVGGEEGRALRKDALSIYQTHRDAAEINNANEMYDIPRESEFINVRQ